MNIYHPDLNVIFDVRTQKQYVKVDSYFIKYLYPESEISVKEYISLYEPDTLQGWFPYRFMPLDDIHIEYDFSIDYYNFSANNMYDLNPNYNPDNKKSKKLKRSDVYNEWRSLFPKMKKNCLPKFSKNDRIGLQLLVQTSQEKQDLDNYLKPFIDTFFYKNYRSIDDNQIDIISVNKEVCTFEDKKDRYFKGTKLKPVTYNFNIFKI